MKAINLFVLGSTLLLLASCESTNSTSDTAEMNLEKVVTFVTNSSDATHNTKNVKHYINNQVVSDSTFNNLNELMYNTEITISGLTKIYKKYLNTGELMEHREENYDSQGRLIGRHTYEPISALFFTYVYNDDGTVTSNYYNEQDNTTTVFRTFTKNADGIINKENGSFYNFSTSQIENYEGNATLQNQKLISTNYSGTVTTFHYYPNPMPTNLLKSVNELNNLIVMGNELRYFAYQGNSYYKVSDDVITTFNSDNYKTHVVSVNTDTTVLPNVTTTTEQFYYYN